jgi:hypothetical protein
VFERSFLAAAWAELMVVGQQLAGQFSAAVDNLATWVVLV